MNSYDRVMTTFKHKEPDRVPVVELDVAPSVFKALMPEATSECDFQGKYLDMVNANNYYNTRPVGTNMLIDEWGISYKIIGNDSCFPAAPAFSIDDNFLDYNLPDPRADHRFGFLDQNVKKYRGEKAISFTQRAFFLWAEAMLGFEELLINMKLNPERIHKLFDILLDYNVTMAVCAVNKGAEIVCETDDYAYNTGPFFGLDVFEEFIFPRLKRFVDSVHKAGALVVKHTDGNIMPILPGIIDCGFDGIHSIDPLAGMDIGEVKRLYGDKLVLIGNIEPGNLLGLGSKEEVAQAVREAIDKAGRGGGYIVSSSNGIISIVKPENYRTMLETVYEYGKYSVPDKK